MGVSVQKSEQKSENSKHEPQNSNTKTVSDIVFLDDLILYL